MLPHVRLLNPYVVLTITHLACQLGSADGAARLSQVLLMPALALWFLATCPYGRIRTVVLAALAFSWLGDTLPGFFSDEDTALPVLIGCFMVAQACYIVAFWARRSRAQWRWLPAYVAGWVALEAVLVPNADRLWPAVLLYGALLVSMAFLTTAITRVSAIGGLVFLASDSLIALDAFDVWTQRGHDALVMLTYCVAQLLIVAGVVRLVSTHEHDAAAGVRPSVAG